MTKKEDQHINTDRYMLRLPDGMRERVKVAASDNNRSMNAEIVATLAEKYPAPADPAVHTLKVKLEAVAAYLKKLPPNGELPEESVDAVRDFIMATEGFDIKATKGDDGLIELAFIKQEAPTSPK